MGGERPVPAALGQEEQLEQRVGVEPEPAASQAQHPHPVLQDVQVHGGRAAPGAAAAAAIREDTGPPRNRPASPRDWPRTARHCPGTASHRPGTALGPPRIAPGPLRNRPASLRQRPVTTLIAPGPSRERPACRWDRPVTACLASEPPRIASGPDPAPIRTAPGQPRHRPAPRERQRPGTGAPGAASVQSLRMPALETRDIRTGASEPASIQNFMVPKPAQIQRPRVPGAAPTQSPGVPPNCSPGVVQTKPGVLNQGRSSGRQCLAHPTLYSSTQPGPTCSAPTSFSLWRGDSPD